MLEIMIFLILLRVVILFETLLVELNRDHLNKIITLNIFQKCLQDTKLVSCQQNIVGKNRDLQSPVP
jgi:hypothetical protein